MPLLKRGSAAERAAELEAALGKLTAATETAVEHVAKVQAEARTLAAADADEFLAAGATGTSPARQEHQARLAVARDEVARLRALEPELQRRLTQARQGVHAEQVAAAEAALARANAELVKSSEAFVKALPLEACAKLEQARAKVEECVAAVREAGGDVDLVDEADYPDDVAALAAALAEGPRQPVATGARRSEELRRHSETATGAQVARAAADLASMPNDPEYVEMVLARVPEDRREKVLERAAALRAEARARQEAERAAARR